MFTLSPADQVLSLLDELEAVERALAAQRDTLDHMGESASESMLADLVAAEHALQSSAHELITNISQHVDNTSAANVLRVIDVQL